MANEYWNKRGRLSYTHKGETFYTVTPLPYYLERRDQLLDKIKKVTQEAYQKNGTYLSIADFGSGDGYYSCWLADKFPKAAVCGYDISKSMVEKARKRAESMDITNARFHCGDIKEDHQKKFDLILILTVLQHFLDENIIHQNIQRLCKVLEKGSQIILFEATADETLKENKMIRRPESFYISAFQNNRFKLIEKERLCFPFFCLYQKIVLETLKKFLKGTMTEKSIWINKNRFYRSLNQFVFSAGKYLDKFMEKGTQGYTLFLFQKTA